MRKPDQVFLSYAYADHAGAAKVAAGLSDAGMKVWSDMRLTADRNWVAAIEHAILESDVFVPLITPDYMSSEWVLYELGFIIGEHRARNAPVVPVLFRPSPIPPILRPFRLFDASRQPLEQAIPAIVDAVIRAWAEAAPASTAA